MGRRRPSLLANVGAYAAALGPPRARRAFARGRRLQIALRTIFRLMERQLDPAKAAATDAVILWEITSEHDRVDRWQLTIRAGRARATRQPDEPPSLTARIAAPDFIELVSGIASGPQLFTTGRLKLHGDLMLAARLQSMFHIPQPQNRRRQA